MKRLNILIADNEYRILLEALEEYGYNHELDDDDEKSLKALKKVVR